MIFDNVVELKENTDGSICIGCDILKVFFNEIGKNKFVRMRLTRPTKKRTDSQNRDLHGNISALALQFKNDGIDINTDDLKDIVKDHASVAFNYPTFQSFDGKRLLPKHSSKCDTVEFCELQKAMQDIADKKNYWLFVRDEKGDVYKSLYGADRQYMRENYPEINGD